LPTRLLGTPDPPSRQATSFSYLKLSAFSFHFFGRTTPGNTIAFDDDLEKWECAMFRPAIFFFAIFLAVSGMVRAEDPVEVVPAKGFPDVRQPQVAIDPLGRVFITFGTEDGVFCSMSVDGGKSYADPVKVGDGGEMALGMRRGPRIAATDKAIVIAAICGKIGKGKDGDVVAWRSTDAGKTWQGPVMVNSVAGCAREGLHHLAAGPSGTFFCVWNDLRGKGMKVYGAASSDDGATWGENRLVYASPEGNICPCCQPVAAYDPKGGLHIMFRNDLGGARDMYLVSSKDHGRTFDAGTKLGNGTWVHNTCPMDAGGLAGFSEDHLQTVWMRNKVLFRCVPGQPEQSLGRGEQAAIAVGSEGFYVVWIIGRPGRLMVLKPDSSKAHPIAESALDPVLAAPLNGKGPVIAAWEEGRRGSMRIKALVLRSGQ
jgi:hypothetical protein